MAPPTFYCVQKLLRHYDNNTAYRPSCPMAPNQGRAGLCLLTSCIFTFSLDNTGWCVPSGDGAAVSNLVIDEFKAMVLLR